MEVIGIWIGLMAGLSAAAIMLNWRFRIKTKDMDLINI